MEYAVGLFGNCSRVFVEDIDHILPGQRAVGIDDRAEQVVRRHGRALVGGVDGGSHDSARGTPWALRGIIAYYDAFRYPSISVMSPFRAQVKVAVGPVPRWPMAAGR